MKRQILQLRRGDCGCCPGHDTFPMETYKNNRSKRARSRDKKAEHQHARSILRRQLINEIITLRSALADLHGTDK